MLFSVDHSFSDSSPGAAFRREAPISPADKEKIAHGHAERLLRF
jgi:predicted TIM-barrel fold metal-dependent hydrolase